MKSRSSVLLFSAAIVTVVLAFGATRMMTQAGNSSTPAPIAKAIADYSRPPQDVWEDSNVKPAEVLKFIGVKPGDKVVDFLPGARHISAMYWSRLFYDVVGNTGKVYPFVVQLGCRPNRLYECVMERHLRVSATTGYKERPMETLIGDPRWNGIDEALDVEHSMKFHNLYTIWDVGTEFSVPEQVDVVWSTSHWHWLHSRDYQVDVPVFLSHVMQSLKPGGVLVIADYASAPGTGFTLADDLHRSDKDAVKAEVTKAGFEFVAENNAWTKADDKRNRAAAQESMPGGNADMFILKFKKPASGLAPKRPSPAELAAFKAPSGVVLKGAEAEGGSSTFWLNPDMTFEDYRHGDTGYGSWFVDAAGNTCMRYEWPVVALGMLECQHFDKGQITTQHVYPDKPKKNEATADSRWDEYSLTYIR